jgi:hypothetical protein
MSRLWLTPVQMEDSGSDITLLADRVELQPAEAAERFLSLMKSVHPRFLVAFKANLLLSEDYELACGIDELPFELDEQEPIIFGPDALELSHCAQAYMDRLPAAAEMEDWLASAAGRLAELSEDDTVRAWLKLMQDWHRQGCVITLLKEEA